MLLFEILSFLCVLSPPFLLIFAWAGFLKSDKATPQPKWRRVVGTVNLLAVSTLLAVVIAKFIGYKCNSGADDWSCVIAWRSFAGFILRVAPLFLLLAIFGAKRTRVLTFLSVLAIVFDVILVDMMA